MVTVGLLIPQEKLHCRCHLVTDNNVRYFIIKTGVRVEGQAASVQHKKDTNSDDEGVRAVVVSS